MSYWTGAKGPIIGPKGPQPSAGTRNKRAKRAVFLVTSIVVPTTIVPLTSPFPVSLIQWDSYYNGKKETLKNIDTIKVVLMTLILL